MIQVDKAMVDRLAHEIRGWETSGDFADYADKGQVNVALEILVDCHWGIHMARRAAELLDITLTDEDIQYDNGWEALEEQTEKLAQQIQAELDKLNLLGSVYFGTTDTFGDYALMWSIPINDRFVYTDDQIHKMVRDAKQNIRQACKPMKPKFVRWEISLRSKHYRVLSVIWIDPETGHQESHNIAM